MLGNPKGNFVALLSRTFLMLRNVFPEILHGVSNLFNLKNLTGSSQSRHVPSNSGLKRERDEKDLVN